MTRSRLIALPLALILLIPVLCNATTVQDLGTVDFPNSGSEEAQEPFIRAVLLLHSFEYEDAREAFLEAQSIDDDFALAYWGEAMTHNHPLWRQQDNEAALAAMARYAATPAERQAKTPTGREKAYLAAVDLLYGAGDKQQRDTAYAEAMRQLSETYPDDLEAKSFYALSVLGTTEGVRDFRTFVKAGSIVEEVFAINPRHPGAAHYLIHSYDDPVHAPLGLRAARVYADIAPAASHAQHMISHIYVALGEWDQSVDSNIKSFDVSAERVDRKDLGVDSLNYHALHWLHYSYLQLGRLDDAKEKLDMMAKYAAESHSDRALEYYAAMRAGWIVETGGKDAPPSMDLGSMKLGTSIQDRFANGYLALEKGDTAAAKEYLADIRSRVEAARSEAGDQPTKSQVSRQKTALVLEQSLAALIAMQEERTDDAVALLAEAAALEESLPLEYGPPDIVKPSNELYGELLLQLAKPAEAQDQFERALLRAPRRTLSLEGAAVAASQLDEPQTMALACAELRSILAKADDTVEGPDVCSSGEAG